MEDLIINVKKVRPSAILPSYQSDGAAGMDAHACIDEAVTIKPMQRMRIPTGISFELPLGYELQVRARSSLGFNHGITMVNGVGTIDCDYRGEVSVALINLSDEDFVVEPDMRIAQFIVAKYEHVKWNEVVKLSDTDRGDKGFGSTGR